MRCCSGGYDAVAPEMVWLAQWDRAGRRALSQESPSLHQLAVDEMCLVEIWGGTRGKRKLMGELQVFVEEAKCVDGSLDVLSHPQLQGEQCGKMAVKQEQTFGAQMGSDSQGWADVSHAGSADV